MTAEDAETTPRPETSRNVHPRRARAESAKRQRLQSACFVAWVDGKSFQDIATETGLARHTVSIYVRDEQDQRAVENVGRRAIELERALTLYQSVIKHYTEKMHSPDARGDEGRYICMARRAQDALLGLVTQHVAIEPPPEPSAIEQVVRGAKSELDLMPPEERSPNVTALLLWCAEHKATGGNR